LLLFISDIEGITGADLTKILQIRGLSESRRSKSLAFFTPGLHDSAWSILRRESLIAVRATALPGQPVGELLHDLAIYTGGVVHSADLGFGLGIPNPAALMGRIQGVRFRPITQESDPIMTEAGLVIPRNPWDQTSLQALGRAACMTTGANGTCLVGGGCPARTVNDLSHQIQNLWLRSADPVRRAGLEQRLGRFGSTTKAPLCTESSSVTVEPGEVVIPLGLASPYFVTEPASLECVLENGVYRSFHSEVHDVAAILPSLEKAAMTGSPLVIVAPAVRGLALACMVMAKLRGVVCCAALRPLGGAGSAVPMLDLKGGVSVNRTGTVEGTFRRLVATADGCVVS
jgi:hypothetical protein